MLGYHLYRRCYEAILDAHRGDERSVLRDRVPAVTGLFEEIAPLRHRETPPEPSGGTEESRAWYQEALYALYAVSRVSNLLLELGGPTGTSIMGRTGGRTLDRAPLAVHEWFFTEVGPGTLP